MSFNTNGHELYFNETLILKENIESFDFEYLVKMLNDLLVEMDLNPNGLIFNSSDDFKKWFHEKEFASWIKTKPKQIQKLAAKYPPKRYKIKNGAPYGVSCGGSIVELDSYFENGNVGVIVLAEFRTLESIFHEKLLSLQHGKDTSETRIKDIKCTIDPIWLCGL